MSKPITEYQGKVVLHGVLKELLKDCQPAVLQIPQLKSVSVHSKTDLKQLLCTNQWLENEVRD